MKHLIRFDWAVKRLLRNKANFGILEGFLSELLHEAITIEQILEGESNKQTADNKSNRVDLLVQDSRKELIIIEIQNNYQQDYLLRMLFGTSKLLIDNMDEGMPYGKIKKVVSVNIVYFDLGRGQDYIYHGTTNYVGIHKNDTLALSLQEEAIYHTDEVSKLYPEYYIIKVNQFDDIAKNTLDEWISFLKTQEIKEGTVAQGLREAKDKLDVLHLTDEERIEYEKYIQDWRDNVGTIVGNYNKGKFEGRQEGIEEGMELGKEIGKEIGMRETKQKIASELKTLGIPISVIQNATGLTDDEINSL